MVCHGIRFGARPIGVPMLDLSVVFLAGLLGSAHCAGMCGGFAIALGALPGTRSYAVRLGAYLVGKALTYVLLGMFAGAFGYALFLVTGVQKVLTMAAGAAMIALGVVLLRGGNALSGVGGGPASRWIAGPLGRLAGRGTLGSAFGLGMLNGLLPCGLVVALLAQAAFSGDALSGALTMGVFGVSTMPALALTGALGRMAAPAFRHRLQRWGGVFVVVLGLLTIARATDTGSAWLHRIVPHSLMGHHDPIGPVCEVPR